MQDDLRFLYRLLRQQLDVAYAAVAWAHRRIDQIALDLMSLERTLGNAGVKSVPACRPRTRSTGGNLRSPRSAGQH